jgi:iron complex transport system ATP-binding protein
VRRAKGSTDRAHGRDGHRAKEGALLEARSISFSYAKPVLEDLNFAVSSGEVVALVGPNGAGKTTLLRVLAGLLKPRVGEVIAPEPRARHVAYLAQGEALPLDWTALEVVRLGRVPHQSWWGASSGDDERAVLEAMRLTGTQDFAARALSSLSGGERQRVALARAFAQRPKLLLLDEPTNHLDITHGAQLLRVLRRAALEGVGVVMVVHDLNLAALCDRVVVLSAGRIAADATPSTSLEPELLERVYGATLERAVLPSGRIVVVAR